MKRMMLVWVMILCLVPLGAWAEAETIPEVHSGMSLEQVEAIWGSCAGSDSYNDNLRWYVKDGHTLICGFAWYNPSKDIWYNGQLSDEDIWGLTDWIEFDSNRRRVGGNIAASDSGMSCGKSLYGMKKNTIICPLKRNRVSEFMKLAAAMQFLQKSPETVGSLSGTFFLSRFHV